jgi:hypothetical protein
MRYSADQKQNTAANILVDVMLAAVPLCVDDHGSMGVDGLAQEACIMSGAFSNTAGLEDYEHNIQGFRQNTAMIEPWQTTISILNTKRIWKKGVSIGLISEVTRSDNSTKGVYQQGIESVVATVAVSLKNSPQRKRRHKHGRFWQ